MGNVYPGSLIDWIALTIRWVFLVSAGLWLAFDVGVDWILVALIILGVAGNILATIQVMRGRYQPSHRTLHVAGDFILAFLAFYISVQKTAGPSWIGLLPLISASLYFQWLGAILIAVLILLGQGFLVWEFSFQNKIFMKVGMLLPVFLGIGLVTAYISRRLSRGLQLFPANELFKKRTDEDAEREHRRAIFQLISELSSSLNYQRVLETSLDLSMKTLGQLGAPVEKLVSAVMLFGTGDRRSPELRVAVSRRFAASDTKVTLSGNSGLIGKALSVAQPCKSRDVRKDPELSRFLAIQQCRSAYCFPLRTGLEAYGILLFAHPDVEFFTPDRSEVLDIVGKQSMIALQNARLYQDLEQEKERMMEIQEEARKKMARDLHDGPTQSVAAIAMRVNFARRLIDKEPKTASEELFKIEELARKTTKEIRHMLFTLRPLVLESQGLVAALESMAEKMRETYNQEVIVQADTRVAEAMEMTTQSVAFYIAEEAVNNARKHAKAPHIWVRLKMLKEGLSLLEVEDDGVGFNLESVDYAYENRGSLGMLNMRERTELVNGVLRIDSAPGRGTRVQVIIPLNEAAAERLRRGL